MSTSIKKMLSFTMAVVLTTGSAIAQEHSLDDYIRQALLSNESVKQKQFQLEKAVYGLKEAKSLFLPTVSLQANYTRAEGGRMIDFPIGDLLNPVYSTLNQLTASQAFPMVQNASIQLNPDNFYDAKFRTVLPLINAEIWYNKEIKKQVVSQQQAAINVYKRQLVKDVKEAYFRYYQASNEVEIYTNALKLVNENIRVNESLYKNGIRNSTALTRAQAEKQKIEASLTNANSNKSNARMYFNFLLNQPFDTEVLIDTNAVAEMNEPILKQDAVVDKREELYQLSVAKDIYTLSRNLQQSHLIPKLNTFLDLGSQGFNWKVDDKSKYYMWGINLQWDLFASNQYRYKAKQATAELKSIEVQEQQTKKALEMQLQNAYNSFNAAFASCRSAQNQLTLSEKYYKDQMKMYKEGQLTYIELLDAQNQLISSQLQLSVAIANTRIAAAEIERCSASYSI